MIKKRTKKIINEDNFYTLSNECIINYISSIFKVGDIVDQSLAYKGAQYRNRISYPEVTMSRNINNHIENIWVGGLGVWNTKSKILVKKVN